ncbi:NHL repeat protein [Leptospira inadai serovar Lyme str. 10]|uniref:NHL repeat protein n=1 Tax=Leptospira inadai serovar Lyme str. 10 TaxID=1049790 RepID=V6HE57_9LEPT|nr:NHL repeat protein [Leptospira inadai serovar Lyme str. 10]
MCGAGKVPPCIKNSSPDNLWPLLLGMNLAGSGGGVGISGSGGSSAPITFGSITPLLSGNPFSATPTISGITVANCTVSPTLPPGLSLNPITCSISGTPTAGSPSTTYTLNASDGNGGTATGTVTFRVASTSAIQVFGQAGSFTTGTVNNGGISPDSLNYPYGGIAFDSSGGMYLSDQSNHRVLYYPTNSTTATRVYGQGGSFTTGTANKGGISANSLNVPYALVLDSSNGLYVADTNNNRVLYFPSGTTTATRVYGQGGSFTAGAANNGGTSASSFWSPQGLALDSSNGLYVADSRNNRVLYFPSGTTTATRVYGQGGSFTINNYYLGGTSANTLSNASDLDLDSSSGLYVVDSNANRVLYYPPGSTTATRVYGQGGSFTTAVYNNGGTSANSLASPEFLRADPYSGGLYICDGNNHRVLYFPSASTTATRVYGQAGSFATTVSNNGGISANSLSCTSGAGVSPSGGLFILDGCNSRVLGY